MQTPPSFIDHPLTSMIDALFMANSAYSLFTYLLSYPEKIETTLFVLGPAIKESDLPHKIDFALPKPEKEKTYQDILEQNNLIDRINAVLDHRIVPCYGNTTTPIAPYFWKTYPFHVLSDGLSDHDRFPDYYQNPRILSCASTSDVIGDLIDPKLNLFDIQKLWNQQSPEQKKKIGDIFHVSADALNAASSRQIVLITQPLSEDHMMSEQDKIQLYTRIIDRYGVQNVVIKPHPRETTQWENIFPGTPVIPRQIPVELLTKFVNLKRVATFFSTAAFGSVSDEKIDFYAADFAKLKSYHPYETRTEAGVDAPLVSIAVSDIEATYRPHKKCHWHSIPDSDGRFYRTAVKVCAHTGKQTPPPPPGFKGIRPYRQSSWMSKFADNVHQLGD